MNKRTNPEYEPDNKDEIKHVDALLKLLSVMTGDDRFREITKQKEVEVHTMCEVVDRLTRKGIKIGEERGIKLGEEKVSKLYRILLEENKISELKRSTDDREYREKLYVLYGIKDEK